MFAGSELNRAHLSKVVQNLCYNVCTKAHTSRFGAVTIITSAFNILGEEAIILVASALRLLLEAQCLEETDLATDLLHPGDPLDLLRSQASASRQGQDRAQMGLIVQPFF